MTAAAARRKIVGYVRLLRLVSSVLLSALVFGAALFFSEDHTSAAAASLAVLFVSSGGFAANDLADIERDRVNTPTRPLPSGALTVREAVITTAVSFIAAVAVAAEYLDRRQFVWTCVYIISLLAYSRISNLIAFYKNVYVAALIASFALFGLDANSFTLCALMLAAVVFLFVFSGEVSGDIYDRNGDRVTCRRTIPVQWGERPAYYVVVTANVLLFGVLLQMASTCHHSTTFVWVGAAASLFNVAVAVGVVFANWSARRFQVCLEIEKHAVVVTIASFLLSS
jgi:geranylgeranylglycerol-phosphate geranylgeranyltransferase